MTWDTTVRLVAWICFVLLVLPAAEAAEDCADVDVSPVADFKYEIVPAETAPIMVNFYSTSDGGRNDKGGLTDPVDSYAWRFGDGDVSGKKNPVHTYAMSSARYQAADKPFEVTLTVKTGCGRSNSTTKNVSVYCLSQKAGFTIVQPVGEGPYTAPVALYLHDTSLHVADEVTTYHYTLWDSGMTRLFKESTEKDPAFIIRNGGRYVIRQEVFKGCSNSSSLETEMKKNIEVTGSASSDAIPMETIPFTTTVTVTPATDTHAVTPDASAPTTTVPASLPEAAPPGTGTLSVVTSPAGAQMFVNDVLLGSSPATIPGLTPGSYLLRLEKSSYRKKTVPFVIEEGKITEYATALEADSGVTGMVPILAAVVIIAAGAGAAYHYMKRKKPRQPDWNNPA
ncbi:MAG: PEGA domain-containing protein [Methanoregulaceae archaeon]|nr:MAG: PEGA domain-containing protein [Methanoregulaceae archaeon]